MNYSIIESESLNKIDQSISSDIFIENIIFEKFKAKEFQLDLIKTTNTSYIDAYNLKESQQKDFKIQEAKDTLHSSIKNLEAEKQSDEQWQHLSCSILNNEISLSDVQTKTNLSLNKKSAIEAESIEYQEDLTTSQASAHNTVQDLLSKENLESKDTKILESKEFKEISKLNVCFVGKASNFNKILMFCNVIIVILWVYSFSKTLRDHEKMEDQLLEMTEEFNRLNLDKRSTIEIMKEGYENMIQNHITTIKHLNNSIDTLQLLSSQKEKEFFGLDKICKKFEEDNEILRKREMMISSYLESVSEVIRVKTTKLKSIVPETCIDNSIILVTEFLANIIHNFKNITTKV